MKKYLIFPVLLATLIFSGSAFAADVTQVDDSVGYIGDIKNISCAEIGMGTKLMKKGSTGTVIKILQEVLANSGYYESDEITGVYDTITIAAVRAFQNESGIKADGVVGPMTRGAMQEICADFVAGS